MKGPGGLTFESLALPVLTVMVATAFLYYAAPILVPLVAAIALAYVLSPAVTLLKKSGIPHLAAVLVVMFLGSGLLGIASYVIVQQSVELAQDLPQYYDTVKGWTMALLIKYQTIQQGSGNLLPALDRSLLEEVNFADVSGVGGFLFKGIGSVLTSFFGIIMILLLTLFLLLDQEALHRRLAVALGNSPAESSNILNAINEQIRGFLLVRFLTTIGLAVVFTVGLIFFNVPYAYVWGPLAGVLNLIPYVGPIAGMVPPVVVAAIQTGELATPAFVLLFFVVIQLLESNVITPKLVGEKVNLNLLAVLLATVYWGWLWGMIGVVLAVPITGAVKVICSHVEQLRPIAVLLGGEPAPAPDRKQRQRQWR